jgi:hypothetical protein
LESADVACRLVRLTSRADIWMTLRPGAARSRSAKFCAELVPIIVDVTTLIVAGAVARVSSDLEAVTTTVADRGARASAMGAMSVVPLSTTTSRGAEGAKPGRLAVTRYVPLVRFSNV